MASTRAAKASTTQRQPQASTRRLATIRPPKMPISSAPISELIVVPRWSGGDSRLAAGMISWAMLATRPTTRKPRATLTMPGSSAEPASTAARSTDCTVTCRRGWMRSASGTSSRMPRA